MNGDRPAEQNRPRPAWYAAAAGPARDWVTVAHLPYSAWHLSYVLIGAGLAAHLDVRTLLATLVAFALAVGIAAHALDELNGRPLGTSIPGPALASAAAVSLAGAAALGLAGVSTVGWGLAGFVAAGVVLVVGYDLELWGGVLHRDAVFALAWGAFPLLTSYFAQTGTVDLAAVLAAAFAGGLSAAQRALSSEARDLRRRVGSVSGERRYPDGSVRAVTRSTLLAPLERALASLSWATCALGVALVVAHTGR